MIFYFFKRVQIKLKTCLNSIEIAFAYKSQGNKYTTVPVFIKKHLKFIVLLGIGVAVASMVFNYRDELSRIIVNKFIKRNNIVQISKSIKRQDSVDYKKSIPKKEVSVEDSTYSKKTVVESILVKKVSEIVKPEVIKKPFIVKKDTSEYFIIVANKAVKSLYLLQSNNGRWRVVKEYSIAIGEQMGKKFIAGDKKTPEGHYCIVGRKERSELSLIYGPLAYVLNYPNEDDRRFGRTGTGIWIHGTDPDSVPVETRGCLEMINSELLELSKIVKKGIGTPVIIVNNVLLTDPTLAPDYLKCEEERKMVLQQHDDAIKIFQLLVTNWKRSWETKNIVEYATFYDTLQFKGQGLKWEGWKERKLRTFNLYDSISIHIDNVLVTDYSDNASIVKFHQRYTTNLNNNEVAKKLLLVKNDDVWKITSESTCSKEELLL